MTTRGNNNAPQLGDEAQPQAEIQRVDLVDEIETWICDFCGGTAPKAEFKTVSGAPAANLVACKACQGGSAPAPQEGQHEKEKIMRDDRQGPSDGQSHRGEEGS